MENSNEAVPDFSDLYSEEEWSCSLIDAACVRPKMYTINGTLGEWAAFIQGYQSGMASHGRDGPHLQWYKFLDWALEQVTGSPNGQWRELAEALQQRYADDEQAFHEIAKLCIEYRRINGPFIK